MVDRIKDIKIKKKAMLDNNVDMYKQVISSFENQDLARINFILIANPLLMN